QKGIGAESANLLHLQLGMFARGGQANGAACAIDAASDLEAGFERMAEELLHHDHHVLIRVIVVVPEDDMVARLPLGFFLGGLALFFDGTLVDVGGRGFEYSGTGLITHGVSFLTARVAYRHGLLRRSLIVAKTVGHYIVR